MKKIALVFLTILSSSALYALPVGNPGDPLLLSRGIIWDDDCCDRRDDYYPCDTCGWWSWNFFSMRAGYYGDFVFNRDLQLQDFGESDIEHTEIYTNAGLIVLNFCDRFDIYGAFGGSEIFIQSNGSSFATTPGTRFEIETETDFSWTIGAKLTFFQCGCTSFGVDGKYFRTTPTIRRISRGDSVSIYPDDTLQLRYHEWQLGVGIAHRVNMFVPYFGVKWSHAKANLDDAVIAVTPITGDTAILRDLEQQDTWGFVYGVSLIDCERMSLTVEGRIRDEKALHINAQIRF